MQQLNRILTTKGYCVKKTSLTELEKLRITKELEVEPIVHQKFKNAQDNKSFRLYRESPERYYLPRQWGIQEFGEPEGTLVPDGELIRNDLEFTGKPYDYQKNIVDSFLKAGGNGLICVPCGRGKTFMAIWTAMRLGRKFLIVVDKEFLMNQWKGELEALVPGIRVGILQEDKAQIDFETIVEKEFTMVQLKELLKGAGLKVGGKREELVQRLEEAGISTKPQEKRILFDCTIAMIQTLVKRDFEKDTFHKFGFTIFDECHHLGAQHFSKALLKVQTKYMLGLSATPTRDDGLTKVFEWFLGKPVYWEKIREPDPTVIVRAVHIQSNDPQYLTVPTDYRGEMIMGRLLTHVVECEDRNKKVAEIILECCKDPKRRILVLSERISHLNAFENLVKDSGHSIGYYIGGMKEDVREEGGANAKILLASYAMASEAMNIKSLNTVILASPRKKVEQSTGRILRVRPEQREVAPLIYDIVDVHDVYRSQYRKRSVYYRKCKYTIEDDSVKKKEKEKEVQEDGCLIMDD